MKDDDLRKLNSEQLQAVFDRIRAGQLIDEHRWEQRATGKQLPPDHPRHHLPWTHPVTGKQYACSDHNAGCTGPNPDWQWWAFIAGRGYGKTQSASNWVVDMAMTNPKCKIAIVSSNFAQVEENCFEGDSAILNVLDENYPGVKFIHNKNKLRIQLPNGSIIQGYTAENPKTIRGSNLTFAWLDEYAFYNNDEFITEVLRPALRISRADGGPPRVLITTTPIMSKPIQKLLKRCEEEPEKYHFTRAFTKEAEGAWLDAEAVKAMFAEMPPEQIRQELEAELLLESSTSYFKQRDFDRWRKELDLGDTIPELDEIVVAVDPAVTSGRKSDESGIVVMGKGIENGDYHSYILEDLSGRFPASKLVQIIQDAYWKYAAQLVIVETNQGGDIIPDMLRDADQHIYVHPVHAQKGKEVRASPIARLNEIGRIHMVGTFEELEDQLTRMEPDQNRRDMANDRADAFVWGMTHLKDGMGINWLEAYTLQPCPECNTLVHKLKPRCPACGTEVTAWKKFETRNEEKSAFRWWKGYQKECDNGHRYPLHMEECPDCHMDPVKYMAKVAQFSGQGNSGWSYSGRKSWFAGRNP